MTDGTKGFASGEKFATEWHKVPTAVYSDDERRYASPSWDNVCVLRIATWDSERVIRRDRIDGISRLFTGAVHRDEAGKEIPVQTTVIIYGGQAIAVGGVKIGTSDALHRAIDSAWLGDGFDPYKAVEPRSLPEQKPL